MKIKTLVACAVLSAALPVAQAADPCSSFKWDVTHEVTLFQQAPAGIAAGVRVEAAPRIEVNRLYEATLQPQSSLAFPAPPSKRMLDDGAHAGLFRLQVPAAGQYRLAIDAGFWVDIVEGGKPLESIDFNGSTQCTGPRKVVVYQLPASAELIVQFSAVNTAKARFTITRVNAPAP